MSKTIQAIKIGCTVNISIDGKLTKKSCSTPAEADELFRAVLAAKENPTDGNIKKVRLLLNERLRIALLAGIEGDPDTGEAYLAGFNTPIPLTLLEVIKEYTENKYPMDAIINFWKLLMINPDTRVRTSLFDFISTHDFVLTDKGYMVVYKAVYLKDAESTPVVNELEEYVSNRFMHVKKVWKEKPSKYVVYKKLVDNSLCIKLLSVVETWDEKAKEVEVLGKLEDLYNALVLNKTSPIVASEPKTVYTDMHTRTMNICLGVPTIMERKDCDGDPAKECSYGLHVGATKYVEKFGNGSTTILACLVNPANVVAVPNYDKSKMRVTEYFPFAVATYINGKIDIVEQKYFESDYQSYEMSDLEEQIVKIKANELPVSAAKNSEAETRPMSELLKIIESRVYDLK